jgi:hypothetical protein
VFVLTLNGIGIYRSMDDGLSWNSISRGLEDKWIYKIFSTRRGFLFAISDFECFRSSDNGDTWETISISPEISAGCISEDLNGNIYVGINGGRILCSEDNGDNWFEIDTHENKFEINSIFIDQNGLILAGLNRGGIIIGTEK